MILNESSELNANHLEGDNKFNNISPSPLRLIVLTSCNCNLNSNININIVYHKLEIDQLVSSIKLEEKIIKGEIKEPKRKQKKKNKLKDKKKKHFSSQITIVLNHQGQTINVKLFGNGKIVVTGAKNLDLIIVMLEFLINKQKRKNQSINQNINDLVENLFDSTVKENTELLSNFSKIVQIIKIIRPYTSLIVTNEEMINNIISLFNGDKVNFLVSYDTFPEKIKVDVNNYNALFDSNMKFDREKFHQILTNNCQILVNYRPSSYQGLNITYYLKDDDGNDNKVTFFAFQDGTFMITGSNRWDIIEKSYKNMCIILDQYYENIVAIDKKVVKVDDRPIKFDYQIDKLNYTFLNKKNILFSNPRNNYLLKNKGLIKYYLN